MATFRFETTCVNSDGPSITAMQETGRAITRRTFLKHVDRGELDQIESSLGYDTGLERGGLRMSRDWHVAYFKGTYRGRPCVYFDHSRIEHVFVEDR